MSTPTQLAFTHQFLWEKATKSITTTLPSPLDGIEGTPPASYCSKELRSPPYKGSANEQTWLQIQFSNVSPFARSGHVCYKTKTRLRNLEAFFIPQTKNLSRQQNVSCASCFRANGSSFGKAFRRKLGFHKLRPNW